MSTTGPDFPESTADKLPIEETQQLISSSKVEGTAVYDSDGDKVGSIRSLMIDKISGQVVYAVMTFGGFLGIGEHYHPVPWRVLRYDEDLGGYALGIDMDKIKAGPRYAHDDEPAFDQAYYLGVYGYYGVPWQ